MARKNLKTTLEIAAETNRSHASVLASMRSINKKHATDLAFGIINEPYISRGKSLPCYLISETMYEYFLKNYVNKVPKITVSVPITPVNEAVQEEMDFEAEAPIDVPISIANVVVPADKEARYLGIYNKYIVNSRPMRKVVLTNLFRPNMDTGMTPDEAFEMLVDTIGAFALHDEISAFTYNLANENVPSNKKHDRSYHHFLKSLYWSIIRNKHLQDHPVCAGCGTTHHLQIHHPDYKLVPRGTEYLHMNILATMCDACHKKLHNK